MKRTLLSIVALLGCFLSISATEPLKFQPDGTFKIVQFTDTHFKYGNPMSDVVRPCIAEVLETEKPHMVVFTGAPIYEAPGRAG